MSFDSYNSVDFKEIHDKQIKNFFKKKYRYAKATVTAKLILLSICEFNSKFLDNILSCNSFLNQCKVRSNNCFGHCEDTTENFKHLIFECDNFKEMWWKLCTILQLDLVSKHVIISVYYGNNSQVQFNLNNIISKMLCVFEKKNETSQSPRDT